MTLAQFTAMLPDGCLYSHDGSAHTVTLPPRTRIIGGDCHDAYYHVSPVFEKRSSAWIYQELLSQLSAGLEPCNDPGCEDCASSEDTHRPGSKARDPEACIQHYSRPATEGKRAESPPQEGKATQGKNYGR